MGGLDISALTGGLGLDEEQKQRDRVRYHARDRDRDQGYYDCSAVVAAGQTQTHWRRLRRGGHSAAFGAFGAMFSPPPLTAFASSSAPPGVSCTSASGGIPHRIVGPRPGKSPAVNCLWGC